MTRGAVSHVPFQDVTEHSHCNYTRSFPSTQKRQTTWENDNRPIKRSPSEGRWFPRKTQALENKPHFPVQISPGPPCSSTLVAHIPLSLPHPQHPQSAECEAGSPAHRLRTMEEAAHRQPQQHEQSSLHCSPGEAAGIPQAPQSHDCWHRGQRARGAEGFPSLASPCNLGPAKDNCLPGNPAGTS